MIIRRGDIYYADLRPVVGSEQGGVRPVLVIQNDVGNKHSPTVICAAITSRMNKAKLPTHVELDAEICHMVKDSVILLEQLRTIDKKRLRDKPLSLFREVLLYPYCAHRAGVGGVHSQRHLVGRDVAGDGDSQSPFHLVYLGAEPGALGAADAEFRVYECFHVGTTSIQNKKRR